MLLIGIPHSGAMQFDVAFASNMLGDINIPVLLCKAQQETRERTGDCFMPSSGKVSSELFAQEAAAGPMFGLHAALSELQVSMDAAEIPLPRYFKEYRAKVAFQDYSISLLSSLPGIY